MTEPLHISASVAALLVLAHEKQLPEPVLMDARKRSGSLNIDFDSLTALEAWAAALNFPDGDEYKASHIYPDGSLSIRRWCFNWNGWHVRLRFEQQAPEPVPAGIDPELLSVLEDIHNMRTGVVPS